MLSVQEAISSALSSPVFALESTATATGEETCQVFCSTSSRGVAVYTMSGGSPTLASGGSLTTTCPVVALADSKAYMVMGLSDGNLQLLDKV
jgi:hypothetical protein